MDPPLPFFQNKEVNHSWTLTEKRGQKEKEKSYLYTSRIRLRDNKYAIRISSLSHIHRSNVTHQLIVYPYPPLPQFRTWIPIRMEYIGCVVSAWCRMAVVVDH